MKRTVLFIATTLLGALTCPGLQAQISVRANVPFQFQAGKTVIPAGHYLFREQGPWIIMRTEDTDKVVATLMTISASERSPSTGSRAHLLFHRFGSAYFLTSVWNDLSGEGREVPPSSREKELTKLAQRRSGPTPDTVTLASR